MTKHLVAFVCAVIAGCDDTPRPMYPESEVKAAKICAEAGLVPDTHGRPYRCIFSDNDSRLK